MSEMIERVARALFIEYGHEPEEWCEAHRVHYIAVARAAIAAMREPTEAMVDASGMGSQLTSGMWSAMIDAALKP